MEIDTRLERALLVDEGFASILPLPVEEFDRVSVSVEDEEIQKLWASGAVFTGWSPLDEILELMEVRSVEVIEVSGFSFNHLTFERWLHVPTLVELLGELEQVSAEPVYVDFDGNDILLDEDGTDTYFTFLAKWGDCPSGCLWNHNWVVRVPHSEQEAAVLVSEGGDPLPARL